MSFCQGCGEKVQTDWNNCINCGTQIATSENQDPSTFSDLELMQSGWTIQQIYSLRQSEISNTVSKHDESHHSISVNNTIQTCDNCGNKLFKGFRKCSHCGFETGLVKKQQFDWENPESTDQQDRFYHAKKFHRYRVSKESFFYKTGNYLNIIFLYMPLVVILVAYFFYSFDSNFFLIPFCVSIVIMLTFDGNLPLLDVVEVARGYNNKKMFICRYCDYSIPQTFWKDGAKEIRKHFKKSGHILDYATAFASGVIFQSKLQRSITIARKYSYIPNIISIIISFLIIGHL